MTIAGTGTAGSSGDSGAATLAQLNSPNGLSADANGNVYIADYSNNKIRRVNSAGTITTFAGTGVRGSTGDGAAATLALLFWPSGVALDMSGNVYIADQVNNKLRMVNSAGIITTFAGTGFGAPSFGGSTGDGAAATLAQLYYPTGIAVDISGNVYIADYGNNKIRRVNSAGIITTYAGTGFGANVYPKTGGSLGDGGAATSAQLYYPNGIALDISGNVYIVDLGNNKIRKVSSAGIITTYAGTGTAGSTGDGNVATSAQLNIPTGVALDISGGNVYIADASNNKIRIIPNALPTPIPSPIPTAIPSSIPTAIPSPIPLTSTPSNAHSPSVAPTSQVNKFYTFCKQFFFFFFGTVDFMLCVSFSFRHFFSFLLDRSCNYSNPNLVSSFRNRFNFCATGRFLI